VGGDSSIKLRLSVWRDFVPNKALILRRGGEVDQRVLSADSDLQQEVYAWQMKEDPFDGISDESTRLNLKKLLVDKFNSSLPPADRRFATIKEFLVEAKRVIDSNEAEWTISQDAPVDDEESPYRLNPLLALVLHLEWLASSFSEQPGVSVSIR